MAKVGVCDTCCVLRSLVVVLPGSWERVLGKQWKGLGAGLNAFWKVVVKCGNLFDKIGEG